MKTVVIYPGRFHPFHKGHASVYNTLVKKFGKDAVWIATSNKIDPPKSPFSFTEKRDMMALTGVDPSRVVQVVMPYIAKEITDSYNPDDTILLFAVSDKDMAEDPRFQFKPKQDGSPSYYQPAQKNMRPFKEHGYIITVPTLDFKVLGQPMRSASEFRANFAAADSDTQKAMMTDLFGKYDKRIHDIMSQKISEQLTRADSILEQLIELGADDKYIIEACQRVDMLKNKLLKESRRQSLYQAIMEGGHSIEDAIFEDELACPVATSNIKVNTENRDRTIKQFNYGPLNVDVPGDYWKDIADYWDTTEDAAKASNCGNCVAFDISKRMKDCMPGDTFDDDGELGYCWMHHFKCHSARSCHTWAKGGPIKKESESAEWQGKAFGAKEDMDTDDQSVTNFKQDAMQAQLMKIADSDDDVKNPERTVTTDDGKTMQVTQAQAKGILQLLQMDIKPDQKLMIQKQIQNALGLRKIIDFVEKNNLTEGWLDDLKKREEEWMKKRVEKGAIPLPGDNRFYYDKDEKKYKYRGRPMPARVPEPEPQKEAYDGGKGRGSDYRAYDEPDTKNNYEVKIDGKAWKVFSSKARANKAASTIANRTGKKVEVYATLKPVSEEITKFNKEDPMSSVIAIRGIGTMTIPQALDKIAQMTSKMAEVASSKDARMVQMNMNYYMDLLSTYIPSVQEAYRELAAQRKRGGTASRGINKDIEEVMDKDRLNKFLGKKDDDDDEYLKDLMPPLLGRGSRKKGSRPPIDFDPFGDLDEAHVDLNVKDVDPKFKNIVRHAIMKYPFAKDAMDAVMHMMVDQMGADKKQDAEIKRLDKENDVQDKEIDDLEQQVTKEHCGDPMAPEHEQGRILLMKLYTKELECDPGSPQHIELLGMINGVRKNIGLDENVFTDVVKKVKSDFKRRRDLFGKN